MSCGGGVRPISAVSVQHIFVSGLLPSKRISEDSVRVLSTLEPNDKTTLKSETLALVNDGSKFAGLNLYISSPSSSEANTVNKSYLGGLV